MGKLNRRDFLKLTGLLSIGAYLPRSFSRLKDNNAKPNVIVIVFDAMSARNLSVYGYRRKTTPNLERFAQRAFVYHSHYSAGNYTTPGTASLLTGMYPWTHRAINHGGQIAAKLAKRNIFSLVGAEYNRYAFGQNSWANIFLNQFNADIEHHLPARSFGAMSPWVTGDNLNDANLGYQAFDSFLFAKDNPPASLLFGLAEKINGFRQYYNQKDKNYPRGFPEVVTAPFHFRLDDLFDGLQTFCAELNPPHFTYLHLYPPHEPYKPSRDFLKLFADDWTPPVKPTHRFVASPDTDERLNGARVNYDRYIANLDYEFGRLLDSFEAEGILDNSYVILTSDHGDLFERGERGHSTPLLYDAVIHIPLLISAPGKKSRTDIFSPTNSIDLLPTLLGLTGREIPVWCEGKPLPQLGGREDFERSTFSVEAKSNPAFTKLTKATVAMRKGKYKAIYYTGYEKKSSFEIYDMENDLEEMTDLHPAGGSRAKSLADELINALKTANDHYQE